jgi:hypothetical protein
LQNNIGYDENRAWVSPMTRPHPRPLDT